MSQTDPVVVCVCVLLRGVEAWDAGVEHLAERESKISRGLAAAFPFSIANRQAHAFPSSLLSHSARTTFFF